MKHHVRLFGVPVRVDPTFLILIAVFGYLFWQLLYDALVDAPFGRYWHLYRGMQDGGWWLAVLLTLR